MWPRAVLFDLDGTLVDSERDNAESVVRAARRFGIEMSDEERRYVIGHSWNHIHGRLVHERGLEVPLPRMIAAALEEKTVLLADKGYTALPGAVEVVRRFAARAKLAIVSGASQAEVEDATASLGVADLFAHRLGAERYQSGKPDPEPYLLALRLLDVEGGDCLVVEDTSHGLASGKAAGARTVGVRVGNFAGFDLSGADAVVETLHEIDDALLARLRP